MTERLKEGSATAKIDLNDKTYTLTFDLAVSKGIEDDVGFSPFTEEFWDNTKLMSSDAVVSMFYHGISYYHPNVAKADVYRMIKTPKQMVFIIEELAANWTLSMGLDPEDEQPEKQEESKQSNQQQAEEKKSE